MVLRYLRFSVKFSMLRLICVVVGVGVGVGVGGLEGLLLLYVDSNDVLVIVVVLLLVNFRNW